MRPDGPGRRARKQNSILMDPALIGACLVVIALIAALVVNLVSTRPMREAAVPTAPVPAAVQTPAPEPSASAPAVSRIRVYAYGRELGEEGFTAYVGDDPFTLYCALDPDQTDPTVVWSASDSSAVSLTISEDRMSCRFTALKAAGRIELKVSCQEAETVFPVYLWGR